MHFDLLQSISLAGSAGVPNDDRAGSATQLAWVIDGATDLGPPGLLGAQGGAAWLAEVASGAFAAERPPLEQACSHVFAHVANRYADARRRAPIAEWELPSASLLACSLENGALATGWLGDCAGLLKHGDAVRWLGHAPDRVAESAAAAAVGSGTIASPAVLADRRAARARPGRRVLSVDPAACAAAIRYAEVEVAVGDGLLLMSDGFTALIDAYDAYTPETLFAAVETHGLAALATELRAVEADDATCTIFPRFKRSDDATALWLRIG